MSIVIPFPLVAPNDDGIRPAGGPDKCFYCEQKIGTSHLRDCVAVTKKVKLRVTLDVELDQPHYSDTTNIESYFEEEPGAIRYFGKDLALGTVLECKVLEMSETPEITLEHRPGLN